MNKNNCFLIWNSREKRKEKCRIPDESRSVLEEVVYSLGRGIVAVASSVRHLVATMPTSAHSSRNFFLFFIIWEGILFMYFLKKAFVCVCVSFAYSCLLPPPCLADEGSRPREIPQSPGSYMVDNRKKTIFFFPFLNLCINKWIYGNKLQNKPAAEASTLSWSRINWEALDKNDVISIYYYKK